VEENAAQAEYEADGHEQEVIRKQRASQQANFTARGRLASDLPEYVVFLLRKRDTFAYSKL
jgi:hypothetical protein